MNLLDRIPVVNLAGRKITKVEIDERGRVWFYNGNQKIMAAQIENLFDCDGMRFREAFTGN